MFPPSPSSSPVLMALSRESWDDLIQMTVGIHKPPSSFLLQRLQLLLVAAAQGPSASGGGRRGGPGRLGRGLPAEDGACNRRRAAQSGKKIHMDRGQRYGHQQAKSTSHTCHGERARKQ